MKKINYRSDFKTRLKLTDHSGTEIGWPGYDWEAFFYTGSRSTAYRVGCMDGTPVNCRRDGDRVMAVFDNHQLGPGRIRADFHSYIPDPDYPDGTQHVVTPLELEIELVAGPGDVPTAADATVPLPVVNGGFVPEEHYTREETERAIAAGAVRAIYGRDFDAGFGNDFNN